MHPTVALGPLSLPSWSLLVTAGVLLCWALLLRRTARLGYRRLPVFLWVLLAFPVGALGARLAAGLILALAGRADWSAAALSANGLTVLGSIAATTAFSVAFIRLVFGEGPGRLLDAVAFTFPLEMMWGRLGCLLHGCCFGTEAPFAATPLTVPLGAYHPSTAAAATYAGRTPETPLWNLPLLFIASEALVLVVVELLWRRRERLRLRDGTVAWAALALDSTLRVLIETVRGGEPDGANPWRLVAGGFALVALAVLVGRGRRPPAQRCAP